MRKQNIFLTGILFSFLLIPQAYGQVTLNHIDIYCNEGNELDLSTVLEYLRICPITPALSASTAPTFSEISTSGAKMSWTPTYTGEDLYGFGIQISTNNITFVNVIENTADKSNPTYRLGALDHTKLYYAQWRNVYYNGTYGDWSDSGSFTTRSPLGGAGGDVIKPVVKPIEELIEELKEPKLKGITAFDIFRANVVRIAPGETKQALLQIVWEGDTALTIKNTIADESTGLLFQFSEPLVFQPGFSNKTTSRIPYVIEAPAEICTDQQTPKCVFTEATYEIPVKIFAESNDESIRYDSFIEVQVTEGYKIGFQEIGLMILGLVAFAVIIDKSKGGPKRSNVLSHKSKPKLR